MKRIPAMFCGHANEVPQSCPCPHNCYCKTHTCKLRRAVIESVPRTWTVWLPGRWPSWNKFNDAKANHHAYHKLKMAWQTPAALLIKSARVPRLECVRLRYLHVRTDRRTDKQNLGMAADKVIPDALQDAGVLSNDGWNRIDGYTHDFALGASDGIELTITEVVS